MKTILKHIAIFFLMVATRQVDAQGPPIQSGYRLEGDEVVFTFDRRDYKQVTHDVFGRKNSDEIDIDNVVVSGEFNNWSMKKWRMKQIDNNIYELRKHINDFSDAFTWEFKYVINNKYWAEPNDDISNVIGATTNGGTIYGVYNLKMYLAYPDDNGNACFKLNGFENAKNVIVAGSFNKWHESAFKMNKVENGWELTIYVKPGTYQYRYIVDGHWIEDPNNPKKVPNEFGEYNSVLDIQKEITFYLHDHHHANTVILSGTFNDWNEEELRMSRTQDGWSYTLPLSYGKHHYKFIVDGEWILDPDNPVKEYDQNSHVNSVYMVR